MRAAFRHGFHVYCGWLRTRPLTTKCATGAAIGFAGDGYAQSLEAPRDAEKPHNWRRAAVFTSFAAFMIPPVCHHWFAYLHRRFPGRSLAAVAKRVASDQLLMAPVLVPSTLCYLEYGGRVFVEGEGLNASFAESAATAAHHAWPTLQANWMLWPAAQAFNFGLVPAELQVLCMNVVGLGWNTYLSLAAAQQRRDAELAERNMEESERKALAL